MINRCQRFKIRINNLKTYFFISNDFQNNILNILASLAVMSIFMNVLKLNKNITFLKNINDVNKANAVVFNSVPESDDNNHNLWQHFCGVEIETDNDFFDDKKIYGIVDNEDILMEFIEMKVNYSNEKTLNLNK